ncbi:hypothetical protein PC128_g5767 [Phytophthora cactorum]|nr:hypothetical protein PC128_g5767 [Phytophthora cactorum]
MVACHWWDNKPVHYLATGPAMTEDTIYRNIKGVGSTTVTCPKLVSDYQRWMGGVDVYDQLRLQTYSIQTAFRFQKYYKSLFMVFLDLALVNAYIMYKQTCLIKRRVPNDRGDWYLTLRKQLFQLNVDDFVDAVAPTPSPATRSRKRRRLDGHIHIQLDDWVTVSGVQKRLQRSCKVCALLRGKRKKSFQTTYYCEDCCRPDAKCYLCPKARRIYDGLPKPCYQI